MQIKRSVYNALNRQSSDAGRQRTAALKLVRAAVITGLVSIILPVSQAVPAEANRANSAVTPAVFQAAGPTAASIQSTVDAFRAALGNPVNNNNPGPLMIGRREINWDGGNPAIIATTDPVTPFNVFLNSRGAQFTTPGAGLSQAAPTGLAVLFNNPTYANIFATFSPSRLFTAVGSRVTNGSFFIPGTNGISPAVITGFGVVFTDVDQQSGDKEATTRIEFFDVRGRRIFQSLIPASPGDGSLSFFGIKFDDARIASIRITTDHAPGPNDGGDNDIVMMDDFIYGEPQPLP